MPEDRKQAIAGVYAAEAVIMQVWPSFSAAAAGRALGRLYELPVVGKLFVALMIPVSLVLYFRSRFTRYTLTTRRVLVQKGVRPRTLAEARLEQIDEMRVVRRPGQAFYSAADIELLHAGKTLLTLPGVKYPDGFRHNIREARDAYVLVARVQQAQTAAAAPPAPEASSSATPAPATPS